MTGFQRFSIFVLLSTLSIGCADNEDLYSSTFEMGRLFKAEIEFVDAMRSYADTNQTLAKEIKEFVQKYYTEFNPEQNPETYVSHPLNALGVLKRTGFDYSNGMRHLIALNHNLTEGLTYIHNLSTIFPNAFAYADACSGVSLLQEAYKLDAEDLADGKIQTLKPHVQGPVVFQSDFKLSWYEMFQIGTTACNRGWLDTGITWYNLALARAPKKARSQEELSKLKEFKKERAIAIKHHDFYLEKRGPLDAQTRTFAVPFDEKLRKKKKYKKLLNDAVTKVEKVLNFSPLFNSSYPLDTARDNFFILCKDGRMATREIMRDSKLVCRYQHHSDPYLRLAPFKLEEISDDPFIVVFHEIIYDKEIANLKERAEPSLKRSEVGGFTAKQKTGLLRTSKQSWIHERFFMVATGLVNSTTGENIKEGFLLASDAPYIPELPGEDYKSYMKIVDQTTYKLSSRIGLATRLEILRPFSSEIYQVANYGIGGQYSTHFDAGGSQWPKKGVTQDIGVGKYNAAYGDRVATFMGYLDDIPLGGATAFPLIGAAVQPAKGSAVFWLNLNPRGEINRLTAHGGCPVLVGSKWITNKWIGGFDQWNILRCGMTHDAKHVFFDTWRETS